MESFYVKDLIKAVGGRFLLGDPKSEVKSVCVDSRVLKRGEFFFALKGKNFDGHDFIKNAVEREAGGIVYSKEDADFAKPFPKFPSIIKVSDTLAALAALAKAYRARFPKIKVTGITGSNGKTTTKEMLVSILKRKFSTAFNKGNFNNRIGLPLSVLNLNKENAHAVFEMGTSEFGEIKILADIVSPDAAIITNIGLAHLETFKNPEGVFKEKRALFERVSNDGFAVINNDDKILKEMPRKAYSKTITFGLYGGADVYAKNIALLDGEQSFELHAGSKSALINTPVKGKFNVYNALAAAAAAYGHGMSLEDIKAGIENFEPPSMRLETRVLKNGITLINDAYNANPSSMKESVLAAVESYADKDVYLVLGDMAELGEKAGEHHAQIGEFIDGLKIKGVYLAGGLISRAKENISSKPVFCVQKRQDLIEKLLKEPFNSKSVVLFKASRSSKLEEVFDAVFDNFSKRKK